MFPLHPSEDPEGKSKNTHLLFSGVLKEFGVGAFARNGSITDMVHEMYGFLRLTSLHIANKSSGFLRNCMDFPGTSAVETLTLYVLSACK